MAVDEIHKIIDSNEKVLWKGKPQFLPYIISSTYLGVIFGIIWSTFIIIVLITAGTQKSTNTLLSLLPFGLVGFYLLFINPIYRILVHRYIMYAITNKRVIIQKGLIGRDFDIIDFDKVTNAEVNVSAIDKLFGKNSGSIIISTPASLAYTSEGTPRVIPYKLRNITDPYKVFRLFKDVSFNIKTDINFPNLYRLKINTGYNTSYKPDIKFKK